MRVLLVEDERKTAAFVARALRREGWETDVLHDGTEALEKLTRQPFDAVVLDIMLPGRDGLSVVRQMRQRGLATAVLLLMAGAVYYELIAEQHEEAHTAAPGRGWKSLDDVLLLGGLPAVILGLLGGWWLSRRGVQPVTEFAAAVEKTDAATLSERLPRSGNGDELDRLAARYNEMLARLETSFTHLRSFALHASHELRTPLTIMRGEMETALREDHDSAALHAVCRSQLEEIHRLTRLIESLTLLAKADAGQADMDRQKLALHTLLRDIAEDTRVLAETAGLTFTHTECHPCTIQGDEARLRQLFLNLAANAVRYNHPGGSIRLRLHCEDHTAVCTFTNTGPGLTAEDAARVFDRFFRGPGAKEKAPDGCGLGLSLARWIAESHRGTLAFTSSPGAETTVTLRLPLSLFPCQHQQPADYERRAEAELP